MPVTRPPDDMDNSYLPYSDLRIVTGSRLDTKSNLPSCDGDNSVAVGNIDVSKIESRSTRLTMVKPYKQFNSKPRLLTRDISSFGRT
jgi:hypothetical protein